MFVDTHCHLNMMVKKKFEEPLIEEHFPRIASIVDAAKKAGVERILNVGTSVPETRNSIAIAARYEHVYASSGIHPCDVSESWRRDFEEIVTIACEHDRYKIKAIGETGLDFYHKPFDKERQTESFKAHIDLALKHDLPLVIHVRGEGATDAVLRILEPYAGQARGVNHCFLHDLPYGEQMLAWGYYLGMDGPIGYPKNIELREIIAKLPLDRLILETDAPFLPPQQYRGKQNSPVYIPYIAGALALAKGVSIEEVEEVTSKNACDLFSF